MTLFLALYVCLVRFPQRRVCFLNEVRFFICFCITGVFRKQKRLDWNTTQNLPLLIEDRVGLERKPTNPGMFPAENIFISTRGPQVSLQKFLFFFLAQTRGHRRAKMSVSTPKPIGLQETLLSFPSTNSHYYNPQQASRSAAKGTGRRQRLRPPHKACWELW